MTKPGSIFAQFWKLFLTAFFVVTSVFAGLGAQEDLPLVMPALDLPNEPVPLWWTTDFILASPEGTPKEDEKWIVGEFNCCSCCNRALLCSHVGASDRLLRSPSPFLVFASRSGSCVGISRCLAAYCKDRFCWPRKV